MNAARPAAQRPASLKHDLGKYWVVVQYDPSGRPAAGLIEAFGLQLPLPVALPPRPAAQRPASLKLEIASIAQPHE